MSALKSQYQDRSSSPSPAVFLRSQRSGDAATERSPRRRGPACHSSGGWARPSVSPFEQSGIVTTLQTYKGVAPARDDHVTSDRHGDGGRGDDDDDFWMCDDDAFNDDNGEILSHEMVRGSSWLRDFLTQLGEISPEEMNDPSRVWLCPACKRGPGASLRYRGFQGMLDHARTVKAKRVKLHRRFTEILEEELRTHRGTQGGSSEQAAATDEKCEGLGAPEGVARDQMILWPPMVVVLNTRLGQLKGSDKWVGMGNRDLLDCFRDYEPIKVRSAYSSHGHCGASLLTFASTVLGYLQAQRLHGQFIQEGRGKYQWYKQKPWKQATEKRLLYGYIASKEEELRIFNYFGDKQKFKYELKPYRVVVCDPFKEMYECSQQNVMLEREIAKEIEHNKSLEKTCKQRALEIEAIRRTLNEQSDEHDKEIESLSECNERLNCKLKQSELERKKMQEQISSLHSTGGATSSTELAKHMNHADGERNKLDNEIDEIAEEQLYSRACDSGDKKKRPLLQVVPCN